MNKQHRLRKRHSKQSARLGAYLAAGVGASMVATSTTNAAIIVLDLGPSGFNILGPNGGVTSESYRDISNFPATGGFNFTIYNSPTSSLGFGNEYGNFATSSGYTTPTKFAKDSIIGSSVTFAPAEPYIGSFYSLFFYGGNATPNFGADSYMGFRFGGDGTFNYGWLEVTWTAATSEFQILSGAYEDQPNVAILAGDSGAAPIPEPGTWAAAALLAGGAAFARWRKRRGEAQQEAA
jgi:hypothetical protein